MNHKAIEVSNYRVSFAVFFVFTQLHQLNFIGLPTISVVVLFATTLYLLNKVLISSAYLFSKSTFFFFVVNILVVFYSLALYMSSDIGDLTILFRTIYFVISAFLIPVVLISILNNRVDYVFLVFVYAALLQSLFVFLDLYSSNFHSWLISNLEVGAFAKSTTMRAIGLSNVEGAAFSVTQGLGYIASLCYYRFYKQRVSVLLCAVLILCSIVFIGRTGLLLSLTFTLFMLPSLARGSIKLLVISIACLLVASVTLDDYFKNRLLEWLLNAFTTMDTFMALIAMNIPELNATSFIGVGDYLVDGKNVSGSDVGYVQNYYSQGVVVSFMFYATLLWFLISCLISLYSYNRSLVSALAVIVFLMFLIEFKEPFIYKYSYILFVNSLIFCLLLNRRKTRHISGF